MFPSPLVSPLSCSGDLMGLLSVIVYGFLCHLSRSTHAHIYQGIQVSLQPLSSLGRKHIVFSFLSKLEALGGAQNKSSILFPPLNYR